ncbi:MAG: methylenetetrahydrofolate reductase C-terminal domain-containing protein [Anaerolineae bacterium]
MALRDFWQDRPAPLVWAWEATAWTLQRIKPLFEKLGMERSSWLVKVPEEIVKKTLFNCQDCAQCVLHYTGMTCPMTCPKSLRNGPCGGVRLNGKCEVKPEMDCVWVKAIERSQKTPYAHEIFRLNPPVDWQLKGQASWVTFALGRDQITTGTDTTIRYATEAFQQEAER